MSSFALAGTLRHPIPLEAIEGKLAGQPYRIEEPSDPEPSLKLVTEVEGVGRLDGRLLIKVRWDSAVQREDVEGTVWDRRVNRVTVCARRVGGELLAFVHGHSRAQCLESKGMLSRLLTGLNAQVIALKPGPTMFDWIVDHDAARLIGAGVRRPQGGGIRTFRLGGPFETDDAEWDDIKASGVVFYLHYESGDGNEYSVYTNGTFFGDGTGFDNNRLETFVIQKVLPRL
jgi:hypothetical protein